MSRRKESLMRRKQIEAVATYLATGNVAQTAAMEGVSTKTNQAWKKKDWWEERKHELLTQDQMELNSRMKKLVDKALTVVADRLENGEFQYDQKNGQLVRVPVKLRDAHKVSSEMIDKQQLLISLAEKRKEVKTQEQLSDRLAQLADAFASFASGKTVKVIDGCIKDITPIDSIEFNMRQINPEFDKVE